MYLTQTIYPLALASLNVVTGWLFFHLLDPIYGIGLVVLGLLVVFSAVGRLASEHGSVQSPSA